MTSDHDSPVCGGSARSTEEAGQRPWRKGAEQDSLFDEGYTAAPEADLTVSTKLAELGQRARKEAHLTNAIGFVDAELLRLAFRSLRKQAAPGVDGQSYEDYAANLTCNLKDLYARLKSGRYRAPVISEASSLARARLRNQTTVVFRTWIASGAKVPPNARAAEDVFPPDSGLGRTWPSVRSSTCFDRVRHATAEPRRSVTGRPGP